MNMNYQQLLFEWSCLASAMLEREKARVGISRVSKLLEKNKHAENVLGPVLEIWRRIYLTRDEECAEIQSRINKLLEETS